MMANKYDCKECANAATPICKLCKYIQRPGGEITKPTMFVRALPAELGENKEKREAGVTDADDLAIRIMACIADEVAIPLRYVMLYNALSEPEEGGNGQTEEI